MMEDGQKALVQDIKELLAEVDCGNWHEWVSKMTTVLIFNRPPSKVALAEKLNALRENVLSGKYD